MKKEDMVCLRCDKPKFEEDKDAVVKQLYRGETLFVKTPCMVCQNCGWQALGDGQADDLCKATEEAWRKAQPTPVMDHPDSEGIWMGWIAKMNGWHWLRAIQRGGVIYTEHPEAMGALNVGQDYLVKAWRRPTPVELETGQKFFEPK